MTRIRRTPPCTSDSAAAPKSSKLVKSVAPAGRDGPCRGRREAQQTGGYAHDFLAGLDVSTSGQGFTMEGAGGAGHGGRHLGTAVEVEPGGEAVLTFIVPEGLKGEWEMGCYEAGSGCALAAATDRGRAPSSHPGAGAT